MTLNINVPQNTHFAEREFIRIIESSGNLWFDVKSILFDGRIKGRGLGKTFQNIFQLEADDEWPWFYPPCYYRL